MVCEFTVFLSQNNSEKLYRDSVVSSLKLREELIFGSTSKVSGHGSILEDGEASSMFTPMCESTWCFSPAQKIEIFNIHSTEMLASLENNDTTQAKANYLTLNVAEIPFVTANQEEVAENYLVDPSSTGIEAWIAVWILFFFYSLCFKQLVGIIHAIFIFFCAFFFLHPAVLMVYDLFKKIIIDLSFSVCRIERNGKIFSLFSELFPKLVWLLLFSS